MFIPCRSAFRDFAKIQNNMFLISTSLLIITIILFIKYKHSYWKRQKIPYLHPNPIYGNVKDLLTSKKSVGTSIFNIYNKFRQLDVKFGGFYMLTAPALLILDPELIKNILIKDFDNFHDRNVYSNVKKDPLSGHLFAAEGPRWRRLRQKITSVFSSGKIKNMFPIIESLAKKLNNILENIRDESVDIKLYLGCFSLDIISNCVFGIDVNALENQNSEFYKYSNLFLATSMSNNFKMAFGMFYADVLRFFNVKTMDSNISDFFINIFEYNFNRRMLEKRQNKYFIDLFLKIHCQSCIKTENMQECVQSNVKNDKFNVNNDNYNINNDNHNINNNKGVKNDRCYVKNDKSNVKNDVSNVKDDKSNVKSDFNDLTAQAFLFFIAGYETSTQTLVFCLYELSLNKIIQSKLRDEIRCWLQKCHHLDYATIMSMKYLDLVVKETLRKYPAAPVLNRKCTKNYGIPRSNCVIEKGIAVWISILGLHMDPRYYKNPEIFDPERFIEPNSLKNIYLPFGIGPRNCIGFRFALLQIKTTLVSLISNFEFDIDKSKTKIPIKFAQKGILLGSHECIYLKVQKIKSNYK